MRSRLLGSPKLPDAPAFWWSAAPVPREQGNAMVEEWAIRRAVMVRLAEIERNTRVLAIFGVR